MVSVAIGSKNCNIILISAYNIQDFSHEASFWHNIVGGLRAAAMAIKFSWAAAR